MTKNCPNISIIIPARNEAAGIGELVSALKHLDIACEILVINDGSTDDTAERATSAGATVVSHPYPRGNGAAIKTGARLASGEMLVFLDGDGQHRPQDIQKLLDAYADQIDMVVGARGSGDQANWWRGLANRFYNKLASFTVNQKIDDLTSGFRIVNAEKFRQYLYLLPNGFSYPTTITMAFFRSGYGVKYVPIETNPRIGESHINLLRDGFRFLLIIFKVGVLYSPLKIFFPIAFLHFLIGFTWLSYTLVFQQRFTNMSATLIVASLIIFLIGLVSEQITMLLYAKTDENTD